MDRKPYRDAKPARRFEGPQRGERTGQGPDKRSWGGPKRILGVDDPVHIYGIHAVEAALMNRDRPIDRLMLTQNALQRLGEALKARSPSVERVSPRDLDRELGPDAVHQGALLVTKPLAEPSLDELAGDPQEACALIALDQVTDPHNVGAVLRSAAVFGAKGLIMTRRHSPPLSGVLAKAASGALEHVPVHLAGNLAQALDKLGDLNVVRVGLDGTVSGCLEDLQPSARIVLVLGAEGAGLRHLTKERCDTLAKLLTTGPIASLNVSTAAAVALHVLALQRRSLTK